MSQINHSSNSDTHKFNVTQGRLLEELYHMPGWNEVFIPRAKKLLDKAHVDIFIKRTSEATAKERIAYYNGIQAVLNIMDIVQKLKDNSLAQMDNV